MTDTTRTAKPRPLSPHLTIYKPIPTMVMSIVHRITGGALYVGTLFIACWLLSAAAGPESYASASGFFTSFFGKLILFGFTLALIHHAIGGIKHLVQDTGHALEKELTTKMALIHPIVSFGLTILIWIFGATAF